jgi:hemolysin III
MPRSIYSDGEEWTPDEFKSPTPVWLIRALDRAADESVARHRAGAVERLPDPAVDHGSTRGERIANWVTHGLGLAVSILAFALLVASSSLYGDAWHIVSFSVFGAALLLLYSIWMLYHAWDSERGRRFILKLGRASAFLLIAGTYTPFLLVSLRGPWGWTLFGVVWGLCGAGIVFQFIVGNRYRVTSTLATLFIGWMIVVAIKPLFAAVPHGGLWLLLAGGLCYTAGAMLAPLRRLRYHYAFRNALVLGGSTCHLLAVLLFVLPQHV